MCWDETVVGVYVYGCGVFDGEVCDGAWGGATGDFGVV